MRAKRQSNGKSKPKEEKVYSSGSREEKEPPETGKIQHRTQSTKPGQRKPGRAGKTRRGYHTREGRIHSTRRAQQPQQRTTAAGQQRKQSKRKTKRATYTRENHIHTGYSSRPRDRGHSAQGTGTEGKRGRGGSELILTLNLEIKNTWQHKRVGYPRETKTEQSNCNEYREHTQQSAPSMHRDPCRNTPPIHHWRTGNHTNTPKNYSPTNPTSDIYSPPKSPSTEKIKMSVNVGVDDVKMIASGNDLTDNRLHPASRH